LRVWYYVYPSAGRRAGSRVSRLPITGPIGLSRKQLKPQAGHRGAGQAHGPTYSIATRTSDCDKRLSDKGRLRGGRGAKKERRVCMCTRTFFAKKSPCVLNAAGGASDTPVATPREPYRVKDFQNSRFFRARALSKMAFLRPFNTHLCRRSGDLNGLATKTKTQFFMRCRFPLPTAEQGAITAPRASPLR
jgi:hypothetical protein